MTITAAGIQALRDVLARHPNAFCLPARDTLEAMLKGAEECVETNSEIEGEG